MMRGKIFSEKFFEIFFGNFFDVNSIYGGGGLLTSPPPLVMGIGPLPRESSARLPCDAALC